MINNIIVFGDSLSDIGNFPESATRLYPSTDKISQHIYLPVRNPINLTQTNHYAIPGLPNVVLSYPDVNTNDYLPTQKTLDGATRKFRAINWTQYLLHEAKLTNLIDDDNITPWITFYNHDKSPTTSVNYAYYSALTTNDCHDQDYGHQSKCNRESIYKTQQTYRDEPQDIINMNEVKVPGFQKQLELFNNDLQQKKITVNHNTAIIIMIGANDIAFAFEKVQSLSPNEMWDAIQTLAGGIADNVAIGLKQIIQTPEVKHIYVMNMYNLGLLPKIYNNTAMRFAAEQLTKVYNHQLSKRLEALDQEYPDIHLNLYDTYAQFEAQAHSDLFKTTLGRQCDENSEYLTSNGSPINCDANDSHYAYLFWNRAHPSSLADQFLAHGLLQFMQATWDEPNKTPFKLTYHPLNHSAFDRNCLNVVPS
ncbi:MAG: hypothetical protein K0U37_08705 [Gammaproteobacteria bacterium]|nr:hypothetical protein [Gammaproteobacteria bacterium]